MSMKVPVLQPSKDGETEPERAWAGDVALWLRSAVVPRPPGSGRARAGVSPREGPGGEGRIKVHGTHPGNWGSRWPGGRWRSSPPGCQFC